jgi:Cytochrome P450
MRLVSPNQFIRRQAREDVALGDQTIRAGDTLLLILAAANRDPEAFPEPDGFVLAVHRPSRSGTGSITASEHPWRGSKAASHCKPCSKVADHPPSRGVGVRRQLQRAALHSLPVATA